MLDVLVWGWRHLIVLIFIGHEEHHGTVSSHVLTCHICVFFGEVSVSFAHFKVGLCVFLLHSFESSPWIPNMSFFFLNQKLQNIFSSFMAYIFFSEYDLSEEESFLLRKHFDKF